MRNYILDELKHNDLMSEKHKKVCRYLNYFEHSLISALSGCISIFASASIVGVSVGIASSAVGLKICGITAGMKKFRTIIKKKHDEIVAIKNQIR